MAHALTDERCATHRNPWAAGRGVVHRAAPAAQPAPSRGQGDRHRPSPDDDIPAVARRGRRRQHRTSTRRRLAAPSAAALPRRDRHRDRHRPRPPVRDRSTGQRTSLRHPLRPRGDRARLGGAHAAGARAVRRSVRFKQVEEAVALRNQVLERLDAASTSTDAALRCRALTVVVVGGGYAGIEALAELEDMAHDAIRYHPAIEVADVRWILVEPSARTCRGAAPLAEYAVAQLARRGITVLLDTRLTSCVDGEVTLSDGQTFDADTIVWTAGVKAHPILRSSGLPVDSRDPILTEPSLAVVGVEGAWAAGDNAAVPDLTNPGALCSPSAQHALPSSAGAGRQPRTNVARTTSLRVSPPARRLGRQSRTTSGCGRDLRHPAARPGGVAPASRLPPRHDADVEPPHSDHRRLDDGALLPPTSCRWQPPKPAPRVRTGSTAGRPTEVCVIDGVSARCSHRHDNRQRLQSVPQCRLSACQT